MKILNLESRHMKNTFKPKRLMVEYRRKTILVKRLRKLRDEIGIDL
jgi:hypothetical protein